MIHEIPEHREEILTILNRHMPYQHQVKLALVEWSCVALEGAWARSPNYTDSGAESRTVP